MNVTKKTLQFSNTKRNVSTKFPLYENKLLHEQNTVQQWAHNFFILKEFLIISSKFEESLILNCM